MTIPAAASSVTPAVAAARAAWGRIEPIVGSRLSSTYINGGWRSYVQPDAPFVPVISPGCGEEMCSVALGSEQDVDVAVESAAAAFGTYSATSKAERVELLESVVNAYKEHINILGEAIALEMGAPIKLARGAQANSGLMHFNTTLDVLKKFEFYEDKGKNRIVREPVGVCGLITPWNWPLNQIGCKVAPALAAGCTMVLKPSEFTPLSAIVFAEIMHKAGVPKGVFNLVQGDGRVGRAISSHPKVDMVSFTGSTRAGVDVAKHAADTVKRVSQELGGKSPNIILEDVADFDKAVTQSVQWCMGNSGQSCNAPTRLLVPAKLHDRAVEIARAAAEAVHVGDPFDESTDMGPLVSGVQYERVRNLIAQGMKEGTLVTGGLERPAGAGAGYFVKPTVFANVWNDMTIARQEVFGPVLAIMPYNSEEEAVQIANDTPYGLAAYVQGGDKEHVHKVASRIRAGMLHLNGKFFEPTTPFGGYKQSGNGREWGEKGLDEFMEVKSMLGFNA